MTRAKAPRDALPGARTESPTPRTPPTARVYAIVARDARTAVVFRRGPTKQVRMLRWDLATDRVEGGQWLSGRIYEERCDLSPDGALLVYFAGKFKPEVDTFTAISRPPFFTALAFWPDRGTWGGGGVFETNRRVALQYGRVDFELNGGRDIPRDFEVVSMSERRLALGPVADVVRQGFRLVREGVKGPPTATMPVVFAEPWIEEKPAPGRAAITLQRLWFGMFERNGARCVYTFRLVDGSGAARLDLGRLDWADWDHDGSLLFSERGRLYRRDVRAPRDALPPPKLVADLSAQTFQNILPTPEAKRWPRA
jgi:hypothetical protein